MRQPKNDALLCLQHFLTFNVEKHPLLQDGARAFDERGAATYMQQILGAMQLGASAWCEFASRDVR